MKVLITDFDFPNVELELGLFRQAGLTVTTAQCKTEDELIAAGKDADAFLLQYAPANRKVLKPCPDSNLSVDMARVLIRSTPRTLRLAGCGWVIPRLRRA